MKNLTKLLWLVVLTNSIIGCSDFGKGQIVTHMKQEGCEAPECSETPPLGGTAGFTPIADPVGDVQVKVEEKVVVQNVQMGEVKPLVQFEDINSCFQEIKDGIEDKSWYQAKSAIHPLGSCLKEKKIDCRFESEVFEDFDQCMIATNALNLGDDRSVFVLNECLEKVKLNSCSIHVIDEVDPLDALDVEIIVFENKIEPGKKLYVTNSEAEMIREKFTRWDDKGTAFFAAIKPGKGLVPFYRFNNGYETYIYVPEAEKLYLEQNQTNFKYEGLAFYAYPAGSAKGNKTYFRFKSKERPELLRYESKEVVQESYPVEKTLNFGAYFEVKKP